MAKQVLIQARMSSQRLPNKVLREVCGKPMLSYLIERLSRCRAISAIVVATSKGGDDDPIADLCKQLKVRVFRGSLDDVLGRFLAAARELGIDALVRVNGDSPLLDPKIVDRAVETFETANVDLVTNIFPRSFPVGQSVEVISVNTLSIVAAATTVAHDREHVTPFFYNNPDRFSIRNFSCDRDLSDVRMAVDTAEDLDTFGRLVSSMQRPHWDYGLDDLIALRQR